MIDKLRVTRVEVFEFKFTTRDWGGDPKVPTGIYNPGTVREARSKGVRIHTDQGVSGTYIGGNDVEYAGIPAFIPNVIGKNPLQREDIYYDAKHALRQHARMGLGVVDCALWDLAGRYYDVPVYELLGGTPRRLPAYASTALGDSHPGRAQFTGGLRRLRRAVLRIGLSSLQDPRLVGCANRKTHRSHSRRGQTHGRKDASHARSVLRHRKVRRRVEAGMGMRRVQVLLVGRPVQGRGRLGIRTPQAEATRQNSSVADRTHTRTRAARRFRRRGGDGLCPGRCQPTTAG